MVKVHQTSEVEADLIDFAKHIANDNPLAALKWLDEMESAFRLAATHPEI